MSTPLSIALLLASPEQSGGNAVVFEHSLSLQAKGHSVTLVTEEEFSHARLNWFPRAKDLKFSTYDSLGESEFDLAMATWWRTVFLLPKIKARTYSCFTQSVESRFYPDPDSSIRSLAHCVYGMDIQFITEAQWIKSFIHTNFGREASVVANGIHKHIFCQHGATHAARSSSTLRILVEGSLDVAFKNVARSIELAKAAGPVEIWLLTATKGVDQYPGVARVFSSLSLEETAAVYRSCDLLLKLSLVEGVFTPPLEMFHCGGSALVYDVSGYDEYIRNGENAIVVQTGDEQKVIEELRKLISSPELVARLKLAALETAKAWPTWEQSGDGFEAAIQTVACIGSGSRSELRGMANMLCGWQLTHQKLEESMLELQERYRIRGIAVEELRAQLDKEYASNVQLSTDQRALCADLEALQQHYRSIVESKGFKALQLVRKLNPVRFMR